MIWAIAPGKVVLWGEYAVLSGAPAMVMAIDRRAVCEIDPGGDSWRISTRGLATPATELSRTDLTADRPPQAAAAEALWSVLHDLLQTCEHNRLPEGARVITDTRGFYRDGDKYGIGSSAAICTAIYAACCQLLGAPREFRQALRIHNDMQGKRGSGIDVAAAYYGGTLRYQDHTATPFELPPDLQLRFVWTGQAASTIRHIQRFEAWAERGQTAPLSALADTSQALFEHTDAATLARYCKALKALDAAADLGIYGPAHSQLDRLAIDAEVVYKPCGAGGGDVGVVIGDDASRLDAFIAAAVDLGFTSIALEKSQHGVQVSR